MTNNTSQHILNSSANLLGFCLVVITSLHVTNKSEKSIIDELTSIVALLLIISVALSFFSLIAKNESRQLRLERIAGYFFVGSLSGILIIIFLIAFNFIR